MEKERKGHVRIAPSILSADFSRLGEEIRAAEAAGADLIHVDVMDGHFVPNLTIGPPVVKAIRRVTGLPLDVHLMVHEPERLLPDFVKAGADYLTVHTEASVHLHRTIHWIKEQGVKAGVSLNPSTPLVSIEHVLADLDLVLIMTVNPGFGGQEFIEAMSSKIERLRASIDDGNFHALLEVDGGIKLSNVRSVVSAGADILVMGSAFFESGDYGAFISGLRKELARETDDDR